MFISGYYYVIYTSYCEASYEVVVLLLVADILLCQSLSNEFDYKTSSMTELSLPALIVYSDLI